MPISEVVLFASVQYTPWIVSPFHYSSREIYLILPCYMALTNYIYQLGWCDQHALTWRNRDVAAEDSAHPIVQHTCPLCLSELGVDDVSWLDQCSAGLDHLEDKEDMTFIWITSQHRHRVIPEKPWGPRRASRYSVNKKTREIPKGKHFIQTAERRLSYHNVKCNGFNPLNNQG